MASITCWVLAGPTASGKTALSLSLAAKHQCQIICMDSMQIYRKMNIGTAKPTIYEQQAVPHHMLDIVDPTENYSVAQYQEKAEQVVREIVSRGHQPLFVGGTGLYLRALRHPMSLGEVAGNATYRNALEAVANTEEGRMHLYNELCKVDPVTADKVHFNNARRVIRALQVFHYTGKPFSQQEQITNTSQFQYKVAMLEFDRAVLYQRIELRVDEMLKNGLIDEVRSLLVQGTSPRAQAMQAIGYKQLVPYIAGECSLQEATYNIKLNTRHYAKRQLTWMRREENVFSVDGLSGDREYLIEKWFTEGENAHDDC